MDLTDYIVFELLRLRKMSSYDLKEIVDTFDQLDSVNSGLYCFSIWYIISNILYLILYHTFIFKKLGIVHRNDLISLGLLEPTITDPSSSSSYGTYSNVDYPNNTNNKVVLPTSYQNKDPETNPLLLNNKNGENKHVTFNPNVADMTRNTRWNTFY